MANYGISKTIKANISADGKVFTDFAGQYISLINTFKGKKVSITIAEEPRDRTEAQNNYYWSGIVEEVKLHHKKTTGEKVSDEDIHRHHLEAIFGIKPEIKNLEGRDYIVLDYKSTSEMSTQEFNVFVEEIIRYWSEQGLTIKEPIK